VALGDAPGDHRRIDTDTVVADLECHRVAVV
jgi:hypothetical protein